MAVSLLKGLVKLGIAGGAVYVTLDQGIWKGSNEGAANLNRLTHTIPNQDKYSKQIPSKENVATTMKQSWNSGVQTAFAGLATAPDKMSQKTMSLIDNMRNPKK